MCSDDTADDDGDGIRSESPLLSCPSCGQPITALTSSGPHSGTVEPCGCSVAPGLIHKESVHGTDGEGDDGE
ncbi:hypothetical protein [Natrinema salsiterrestre]|uniref:Small CPxCG-related zinc finger protein n=1 Tax=Natrinema salsiterrestre TaxID=2950540 RepID=A0A9Q4Q3Q0_9EURY|nr:hypothetical protein [Natrinema salsiterrestre]MDF9746463.1 hypothetical protein [Natrinema salsiterrestre]